MERDGKIWYYIYDGLADDLTEAVKDILFDLSKEYDRFEDVWNLIYHLKVK